MKAPDFNKLVNKMVALMKTGKTSDFALNYAVSRGVTPNQAETLLEVAIFTPEVL